MEADVTPPTTPEHQGRIVADYRRRQHWTQQQLADALHVEGRTVQRMEGQDVIKNVQRRRLLVGLLGIPAALLGLEAEQRAADQARVIPVNQDRMSFLEDELSARWELYYTGGTARAARGLPTWTHEIAKFASAARGTPWQRRAYTLLAVSYQLQSCLFRDQLQYADAHQAYQQAARIAQGLDDAELLAAAMAREGVTLLQEGQPRDAIAMLQGALDTIAHAGLPALRGYLLQALSEAYASVAEPQASWRAIGLAERVLERGDMPLETSIVRFSAASVIAQKGVDAVLLRDDDRAVALIDKSLATYDPTQVRGRARLLAQKAEAYSRLGHLDACVATAEEALALANAVGSAKTVARVERLHATLAGSHWRREPAVYRLGALLSL